MLCARIVAASMRKASNAERPRNAASMVPAICIKVEVRPFLKCFVAPILFDKTIRNCAVPRHHGTINVVNVPIISVLVKNVVHEDERTARRVVIKIKDIGSSYLKAVATVHAHQITR